MSLAEELRAIRGGFKRNRDEFKRSPEVPGSDRPWQEDIYRVQQTLQEVLQAISRLSGVELPGANTDYRVAGDPLEQLHTETLKNRIRNDLETFASTTASELAQQTERQTRADLTAVLPDATGQVELVARGYREKLQGQVEPERFEIEVKHQTQDRVAELVQSRTEEFARWVWLMCKGTGAPIPVQVEKLLEPYAEEATGRLLESSRHRFNEMLTEHVQMAQEQLKGSLGLLDERISEFDQSSKRIPTQKVATIAEDLLHGQKSLPKDERLEARVTGEQKRLIEQAAEIRGTSMTDLIVASALDAAAKVIKDHDILVLNDGASREFAHALLNPPAPGANAKEAWRRYRKRVTAK